MVGKAGLGRFSTLPTVVLAAACGSEGGGDARLEPPRDGAVRVEVLLGDPASEHALVLFSGPDGTLAEAIETDARGRASHALPAGGSVTVVHPGTAYRMIETLAGVVPGDDLRFGFRWRAPVAHRSLRARLPPPPPGATRYHLLGGSGVSITTTTATTARVFVGFGATSGIGDVVIEARDDDDTPIAYQSTSGLRAEGREVELDLGAWRTDWRTLRARAPRGPADHDRLRLRVGLGRDDNLLLSRAYEHGLAGGDADIAVPLPRDVADQVYLLAIYDGERSGVGRGAWRTSIPAEVQVDPAEVLPPIRDVAIDTEDPRLPVLSWRGPAALGDADALRLFVQAASTGALVDWIVELPPSAEGTFTIPEFPAWLERPTLYQALIFEDYDEIGGWADHRRFRHARDAVAPPRTSLDTPAPALRFSFRTFE